MGRTLHKALLLIAVTVALPLQAAAGTAPRPSSAQGDRAPVPMPPDFACPSPEEADSPAELLNHPARAWSFDRWLRSRPLSQESLRGKVVLIRWFTEGCRYCRTTLPEIEALRTRYGARGLVVIGVFHPKPRRHLSDAHILAVANDLGFGGPIAVDERWSTLERWWLNGHPERNWTSVSFLIDTEGVVRWAHSGGEYHPSTDPRHAICAAQAAELEDRIRELLAIASASR